ncbi:MAG: GxGYxYP family putative glycoside hydrolase [Candidatus Hydrogenedentota bacterium]
MLIDRIFFGCVFMCVLAIAAFAAEEDAVPIAYYDMTALNRLDLADPVQARRAWDTAHLVASVQGIVNREEPRLFVRFMKHPDDFWFEYCRNESEWLTDRPVETVPSLEALLRRFADDVDGVVVYDDRVPATSNLASTIAGIENRVCLRYDPVGNSVYSTVMAMDLPFVGNVKRLMNTDGSPMFTGEGIIPGTDIPSTGSAKCDAHLWAKHHYLDTEKCSNHYMAYYIDAYWLKEPTVSGFTNATLTNHDFFIANKALFFDLHVWEEEAPVDDPGQNPGTDVATLHKLLQSMYRYAEGRIIHIGGFTPWAWKYTNHGNAGSTHGGVDTEWKYAQIISAYNGIMDADALGFSGMANASFYQHFPLKKRYSQNRKPSEASLRNRGLLLDDGSPAPKAYVCFYMGDYDAAAWLNFHVPKWWRDPAHGATLCTWAFNPNLDRRAPQAMHYARTHQSRNDWFMYGDSGSGYLNPGMLLEEHRRDVSGLPSGIEAWVAHNRPYAERYDLSITGFIIDGHSPGMGEKGMEAYLEFSPDGIVGQKIPPQGVHQDIMPYVRMKLDLDGAPPDAGATIASLAGVNAPKFLFIRTILKSPSWHRETMEAAVEANASVEFVDPYTFFLLVKAYERMKNHHDAARTPVREVTFVAGSPTDGLAPVRVADGPFAITAEGDEAVLRQAKGENSQYLYFEISDAFCMPFQRTDGKSAVVMVSVLDDAPGEIGIHYDSHTGSAYRAGPRQKLTGSGQWVELSFDLPDAAFTHGQNGGADFRFVNFGNELVIRRVRIKSEERSE